MLYFFVGGLLTRAIPRTNLWLGKLPSKKLFFLGKSFFELL